MTTRFTLRFCFLLFCLFALLAAHANAQNTGLIMDSPQGDYIGEGQNLYFTAADGSFTCSMNYENGASINFNGSGHNFTLDFAAPGGALLAPGTYSGAARFPFQSSNQPGLDISGDGRGSYELAGSFVIKEIVYSGATVTKFDATFVQHSEVSEPALTGEILYNSSNPLPPKNHILSDLTAYATKGQPFTYQIKTSRANTSYAAQGLPDGLSIDASTGTISGSPTMEGDYQVMLSTVSSDGNVSATLDLTVTPASQSTGPYSALQMQSDAGDYIGQGKTYSFTAKDGTFSGSGNNNHVGIQFSGANNESWTLNFSAPTNASLGLGDYENATEFATSSQPGLEIYGDGRADNTSGSFTVQEITFDNQGMLQSFHATFIQHTNSNAAALRGTIWYQVLAAITSELNAFGKENRAFSYQIIANNQSSSFSATGLPTGLSVDPQTGIISGVPTQSGDFAVALQGMGATTTVSDTLDLMINPSESLGNLSTRLSVGTGDNVLIGGFIITGNDPKKVIVRAIGPSLASAGVSGAISDPNLELHDGNGSTIATNDDWRKTIIGGAITADQRADILATGLAPTQDLESAILLTLAPGSYTAIVQGFAGATGIGLVEVYDLSPDVSARLANISTRGFINTGDDVMIGGFIIEGANGSGGKVIVRALGPSLAGSGVSNVLADPTLELHDANGNLIASNDNWEDSQEADIEATGLAPSKPMEAAILTTQPAGAFTAIVRGYGGTTGNALIEVYNL